jgi:lysozyme
MQLHPRLSRAGVEFVKRFEGLRCKAARLADGGWTIGYGHTVSARDGAEVTEDEAEALLLYDLDRVAKALDPLVFTPLNSNQFDALAAFAFNIGVENFRRSAVLARLNEGDYLRAAAALELWRRAELEGEALVVDALVRRRAAEKALFLTPPEGFRPAPTPVVRPRFDGAPDSGFQPVTLHAPLDGDEALVERAEDEPLVSPAEAAHRVSLRLQALYPDDHPAEEPFGEPRTEPEAAFEPEPEPEAEPPPFAHEPDAFTPPQPQPEPAPAASRPEARPHRIEAEAPARTGRPPVVMVGGVGLVMFLGSLAAMLYGSATPLNLAVGLIGVACMAPAGLNLLLKAFGAGQDRDWPR